MIELERGTNRSTPAHIVNIDGIGRFFFSYKTCIAFAGRFRNQWVTVKRTNVWGPTTGRHFYELGCWDYEEIDGESFERMIEEVFLPSAHWVVVRAAEQALGPRARKALYMQMLLEQARQAPLQVPTTGKPPRKLIQDLAINLGLAADYKEAEALEWGVRQAVNGG